MRKSGQVSNPGGFSPSSIQKSTLESVPIHVIYRTYCPRTAAGMYSLSLFFKKNIYIIHTHKDKIFCHTDKDKYTSIFTSIGTNKENI